MFLGAEQYVVPTKKKFLEISISAEIQEAHHRIQELCEQSCTNAPSVHQATASDELVMDRAGATRHAQDHNQERHLKGSGLLALLMKNHPFLGSKNR